MKTHMISKISHRISNLFPKAARLPWKRTNDHQLAYRIVALNRHQSPDQIISETAACLKKMVNYRLFAFAFQAKKKVDIWQDPGMYEKSLEKTILKDFNIEHPDCLNYLNQPIHQKEKEQTACMEALVSYRLTENNCISRVYIIPDHNGSTDKENMVNLVLQSASASLSRQVEISRLKNAAVIDPLTRCYNRREFKNQLNRNAAGAIRHKTDLSVFMFDLDHFKKVNDTYGHPAGDKVLKEVASLVQNNIRTNDVFARYGGEEFIAILPDTGKQKAMELADRLRRKIADTPISYNGDIINVTASFGIAQMDRHAGVKKIIQDADVMLYKAKLNGRNTIMPGLIKVIPRDDPSASKKQMTLSALS